MSIKRCLVLVAAMLLIGTVAQASNMGFKITIAIDDAGTYLNNWVSVPYHVSYNNANDMKTDLNSTCNIYRIYRWIPSGASEGYQYFQSTIPPLGTNFAITPGESYLVIPNTGGGGNWVVVGSHDPGLAITIDDAGTYLNNWISVPYHTMAANANVLKTELNASGANIYRIYRWIPSGASEGYQYFQSTIPPLGTNFSITPGEGLLILPNTGGGGSWTPSHY